MQLKFKTSTTLEDALKRLFCLHHTSTGGVFSIYLDPEDEMDWGVSARIDKGEALITTPTSGATWMLKATKMGMDVTYNGPFPGLGASPYIQLLELDLSLISIAQVSSSEHPAGTTWKEYAAARLRKILNGETRVWLCWPAEGWCPLHRKIVGAGEPVLGFEHLWPGTPGRERVWFGDGKGPTSAVAQIMELQKANNVR